MLAIAGVGGAILHAAPLRWLTTKENWPALDAVDLGWVALIAVAALLPWISKLTFAGVSVEIREAKESADELVDVISDYANLVQNWSSSLAIYVDAIGQTSDETVLAERLRNYIRDRMGEALDFLSDDPKDKVRIGLWIFIPDKDLLEFRFGVPNFTPTKATYAIREGMIGQAFDEQRRFMESDVRRAPNYINTRGRKKPPYRAVWCGPVSLGQEKIGMLTLDKKSATLFSHDAEEVARGLAAQCALAIDQYRSR